MSKLYKFISWEAAIVILSLLFWGGFARLVGQLSAGFGGMPFSFEAVALPAVFFLSLASLLCLGILFFGTLFQTLSSGALAGAVFLLSSGFTDFNLAAVGILILCLLYSRLSVTSESRERIKINARIILSRGLTPIFIGLLVMVSFVIYENPGVQALEKANKIPPSGEKIVSSVITNFIGGQIEGNPREKQAIIKEITRQTMNQLNSLAAPYLKYAPPVLTASLFLIIWGVHEIFVWLSILIGSLLFFALKKAGFVKIEERDAKAETLIL